jgi:hypothetical protein
MKQLNNSKKIKTILVERKFKDSTDIKEYNVDADIFDDVYLEAATRYVENYIKERNAKITPILSTYDKNDINDFSKHYCFNSYYIIINAGYHIKAEAMRDNFKKISGIDLKYEKLKSGSNE